MIKNFEKETHELTEQELKIVPIIVKGLSIKVGKDNVVTNKTMVDGLKLKGWIVNPARIRKIIHHIRVLQLVPNLISTNKGYYIATTQEEVEDYVLSLEQRVNSINEVINSYKL